MLAGCSPTKSQTRADLVSYGPVWTGDTLHPEATAIAVQMTIGKGDDLKGIINLINMKAFYFTEDSLGAKDEGPAGPRGEGFYAGYFRDPDGNKLNVFCMG